MGYKNLMCEAQRLRRRSRSLVFLPLPMSYREQPATNRRAGSFSGQSVVSCWQFLDIQRKPQSSLNNHTHALGTFSLRNYYSISIEYKNNPHWRNSLGKCHPSIVHRPKLSMTTGRRRTQHTASNDLPRMHGRLFRLFRSYYANRLVACVLATGQQQW